MVEEACRSIKHPLKAGTLGQRDGDENLVYREAKIVGTLNRVWSRPCGRISLGPFSVSIWSWERRGHPTPLPRGGGGGGRR